MSYTCPRCKMTSHNPDDELYGYCGNCHAITRGTQLLGPPGGDRPDDGFKPVVILKKLVVTMKSGQKYEMVIEDPRVTVDMVMAQDEIRTSTGAHLKTSEIESYDVEETTTVIPDSPEGLA